ncbi:MAG: hypothetical protein HYT99_01825, partial [Candidatus Tectomicrobia bacterium]|nr:hypothetical protein [Candidatus Tectomicrobia bacterium]
MRGLRLLPLLAPLLLLAGCVGLDEFERKSTEAVSLRRQLENAQARIGSLTHDVQ